MTSNSETGISKTIEELLKKNHELQINTNRNYTFNLNRGSQRIESFLSFFSVKYTCLKLDVIKGNSIKLFYIPVHLRTSTFDISDAYNYGRLYFLFSHNGKIKFQILLPTSISNKDIQSPILPGELIFDETRSDNHELAEILIKFLNQMNEWEENGNDGVELFIDLPSLIE